MEGNKLCQCCKKNHAVKVYEGGKEPQKRQFYCLECYSRLFLVPSEGEEYSLSTCPYCGTSLSEAKASKLVGCAHCYEAMQAGLFPLVQKMQGGLAHTGKTPPLEGEYADPYDYFDTVGAMYRASGVQRAKFSRQCHELEVIIEHLTGEGRFDEAKGYAEKLAVMKTKSEVEEDFVCRTRRDLLKQS